MSKSLRVTLLRSRFGHSPPQTAALEVLGLKKIRQQAVFPANSAVVGNLRKVIHLVRVEQIDGGGGATATARAKQ